MGAWFSSSRGRVVPEPSKRAAIVYSVAPDDAAEPEPPPPQRLTSVSDILASAQARQLILSTLHQFPPSVPDRWRRIVQHLSSGDNGFPIVLELSDLRQILISFYQNEQVTQSEGLAYMRKYMPVLYEKHSLERGTSVSKRYRDEKGIHSPMYAYGEIEYEIFASLFLKTCKGFGAKPDGVFCDLGCGVGSLVYCAAFVGNFSRCFGIEFIPPLYERALRRMPRWTKCVGEVLEKAPRFAQTQINWINSDLLDLPNWVDASFIFLHWTSFSLSQRLLLASQMAQCEEGTFVVSLTYPVPSADFALLVRDQCSVSWGTTEFFVQEKITPLLQL